MFVLKNLHAQSSVKQTPTQDSAIQNTCWEIFIQWCYHRIIYWYQHLPWPHHWKHTYNDCIRQCALATKRPRTHD